MIQPPPFPISIDQLDPATLSVALEASVVDFSADRIGADRGMLGEIFLVTPRYECGHEGPEQVICKFAALRDEALASAMRGGTNERELRCYDELLASTAASTPTFHAGWYDPSTAHFLMVQEAVGADTTVDQVAGITPDLVGLTLSEAATLHSERWNDPAIAELAWLPALDDPRRISNLTTLARSGWEPLCDLVGDAMTSAERALGTAFPERLEYALGALARGQSTFIHSDLRADNLLFAPDHRSVRLIDWQGAGVGPGAFDVAYLLSHSMTIADRREHGEGLIDNYLGALGDNGIDVDRTEFETSFGLSLHYGLAVACALPIIGDSSLPRVAELASAMATRSLAALADYDQLW